jgi:hypothetical protein
MPGGTGVLWVDEHNLTRIGLSDITKGTHIVFTQQGRAVNAVVKDFRINKAGDIHYDVEYASMATICLPEILRVG